jgi:hypothetical protein
VMGSLGRAPLGGWWSRNGRPSSAGRIGGHRPGVY